LLVHGHGLVAPLGLAGAHCPRVRRGLPAAKRRCVRIVAAGTSGCLALLHHTQQLVLKRLLRLAHTLRARRWSKLDVQATPRSGMTKRNGADVAIRK